MIRIGFSQGDINGTSLALLLKLFQTEEMFEICTPVLYGSHSVAVEYCKQHNIPTKVQLCESIESVADGRFNMIECCEGIEIELTPEAVSDASKQAAKASLEAAIRDLKTSGISALVCLPTQGVSINVTELLVSDTMRIVFLNNDAQTTSEKLAESVTKALQLMNATLKKDFLIDGPRFAVLSSSVPEETNEEEHTAEGAEEAGAQNETMPDALTSAIENEFANRTLCFGPYNPKTFMQKEMLSSYDALLFADKDAAAEFTASNPVKDAFYYSLGLPVVIVGTKCDNLFFPLEEESHAESTLRHAIYTAVDATRHRGFYDKARMNVLRRQYYEKRDDSDKLKLD